MAKLWKPYENNQSCIEYYHQTSIVSPTSIGWLESGHKTKEKEQGNEIHLYKVLQN